MVIQELHKPDRIMNVAGFMSGKGTNLIKIIEYEQRLRQERGKSPYHVAVIFSDNHQSKANEIGAKFGVPVFTYDLESFCAAGGFNIKDMDARAEYEWQCVKVLDRFDCTVAAYAGYMRKATPALVNSFLGINVHPADLTIKGENGKPKYRGDHAVLDAMQAGEKEIRSTTHIVEEKVDCGSVLMVSAPVNVECNLAELSDAGKKVTAARYQDDLKGVGDWVIFPKTLEYIADGRFAADDEMHNLYFDGNPIPNGVRL
jgi:folate-dependent phosphoribosylglycinamide formyltransferase PurN